MVSLRVVVRRCPDCGARLTGFPGLPWLACIGCPQAVDPFSTPARKVTCWRPCQEMGTPDDPARLSFYLFRLDRPSEDVARPAQSMLTG